jgi:hypothetical protein
MDGVSERVFAHRDVTANRGPRRVREIVGRVGVVCLVYECMNVYANMPMVFKKMQFFIYIIKKCCTPAVTLPYLLSLCVHCHATMPPPNI